jgi:hypothetical protein
MPPAGTTMFARFKTRKWRAMTEAGRIGDYLQRLTPLPRSCLLTELERLEVCGDEIPGSAALLEKIALGVSQELGMDQP